MKSNWNQRTPTKSPKSKGSKARSTDIYAVQCGNCYKWRVIPTQEEFEDIRSRMIEEPFSCGRRAGASCRDAADIEYGDTHTWVIDRPNIPKTPEGFTRHLRVRRDFSKLDAHYVTPTGKPVKCVSEVLSFLEENPHCKASVSDFNFACPKIMKDTIPENVGRSGGAGSKKRAKIVSEEMF